MSKWCNTCYRNEMTGEWESCNESCPIFGMHFEDLSKRILENSNKFEDIKKETAEKIATYLENHWSELQKCWCPVNGKSEDLRSMIKKAIQN